MAEGKQQDYLDLADEEVNFEHVSRSTEESEFEAIISALEELLLDPKFEEMQNAFCERHCDKFEETKENKIEYTAVFGEYTHTIETLIEQTLKQKVPGFEMSKLEEILKSRRDELSGDVFETLYNLGDFLDFKDLMLSYKNSKEPAPAPAPAPTASSAPLASSSTSSKGKGNKGQQGGGMLDLCITGKHI